MAPLARRGRIDSSRGWSSRALRGAAGLATVGALAALCGCSDPSAAPASLPGELIGPDGTAAAGVALRLVVLDDQGQETTVLASTVADESGRFDFELGTSSPPQPNASLVVSAELPNGQLRGYWAGTMRGTIPVHPLTEALVTLIVDLTASPEGRTTLDFVAGELEQLGSALFELDLTAIDLSDREAVRAVVREQLGAEIAAASGGQITVQSTRELEGSSDAEGAAPFGVARGICAIGSPIFVLEGSAFRFDVEEDGTLCGGSSESLPSILGEGALRLITPGRTYFLFGGSGFPSAAGGSAPLEDQRELRLGPVALATTAGGENDPPIEDTLLVTRKVFVAEGGNVVRYLDTFTNTGTTARAIDRVLVQTFLTTGTDSALLTFDGDTVPATDSRFVAAHDASGERPTVGFVFQDGRGEQPLASLIVPGLAGGQANEISYGWTELSIPAGESRSLLHYAVLSSSRFADDLHARLAELVRQPDMAGLSRLELAALVNFAPNRGTVVGEAGAVIGGATVTARSGTASMSSRAATDGSFAIPIAVEDGAAAEVGIDVTP